MSWFCVPDPAPAGWSASRRAFLAGAGTGLAATMAGCRGGSSPAGAAPSPTSVGASAAAVAPAVLATPALPFARSQHATALLDGGLVLLIGGLSPSGMLASCQVLDPNDGSWYDAAPLGRARGLLTASTLADGTVLCLGGFTGSDALAVGSVFDPVADSWEPVAPLATARYQHSTQRLADGRFVVTGGVAVGPMVSHEVYELS